jgi:hypothetical protein
MAAGGCDDGDEEFVRRWQRAGVMMVVMNYSHDGGGLV